MFMSVAWPWKINGQVDYGVKECFSGGNLGKRSSQWVSRGKPEPVEAMSSKLGRTGARQGGHLSEGEEQLRQLLTVSLSGLDVFAVFVCTALGTGKGRRLQSNHSHPIICWVLLSH